MSQSTPESPNLVPGSKPNRLSRNAIIGIVIIVVALVVGGAYGGNRIYQDSLQPNIQATAINIGTPTADPVSSTPVNQGRVTSPGAFDYRSSLAGTYDLVWDNSFSVFTSKSVSVSYTVSGSSTKSTSFTVQPGTVEQLSFDVETGVRIYGTFTVSGGSNDVNFYIIAHTCSQMVSFSFTLVNPGNANGFGTARLTEDGHNTDWSNRYYVPQGGQVQGSGAITFPECSSHTIGMVVTQEKA